MIIFLNGSINAGKSTIAKLLTKGLPNTSLLEIDALREMVDWMPLEQAIPINLENAVSLTKNFTSRGLNVIIPYPLLEKNYKYFMDQLEGVGTKIFIFTLAPRLEKTLTNRGTRELTDLEKTRIKYHYDSGIHDPSFGDVIDNSEQTAEETKNIILDRIRKES